MNEISNDIISNLNEMAKDKDEIIKELNYNYTKQIIYNLICLYAITGVIYEQNKEHWKEEICDFRDSVSKFKGTKKYPTYKQLCSWDFNKWNDSLYDHLRKYIEDTEIKENIKLPNIDREDLKNFILEYFTWLYEELSIDGTVTKAEVKECINNLLNKYNRIK